MIVPDFWAEAQASTQVQGRRASFRRFGWSNESQADAQAQAEARVAEAIQRAASGQPVARRERKLAYNGVDGLPIREEVLERYGEAAITRNAYGARCLNVPDLLIADVDFEAQPSARLFAICALIALCVFGFFIVRHSAWLASLAGLIVVPIAASLLAYAVFKLKPIWAGSPVQRASRPIHDFMARHPDWRLRLYRTPAGLRLIATHARFAPGSESTQAFFKAVGADPLYAQMCLRQDCFRARLSAKPWRAGVSDHLKPRPGIWPIQPERLPARAAWVARYEQAASAYAACHYEETLGTGAEDAGLAPLVALHDTESRALDGTRPLA